MSPIFRAIGDQFNHRFSVKNTAPANEFVGFRSNGAIVVRERRKAEIPNVSEKSETLGSEARGMLGTPLHLESRSETS
ncbi:MAG: hypothetical protein E7813_11595 [Bradyrhizobium sp.]|uniref:hypothetical protein n=1 Tax=Bradyrhizobium sp. TaxID=376 RepID=UPI00121875CE|nr:hypothetical protein [Bradyrhizobium sp.]THD68138.1 MAG: hypothetical protein E7813_11595 [Bradyrhizobium sp.]